MNSGSVFCCLSVLALSLSCSGPDAVQEHAASAVFRMSGSVQKGPLVEDSVVRAVYVWSEDEASSQTFETRTTNDMGDFSLDLPSSGLLSVSVSGRHYDEALGRLSHTPITLRAYGELSGAETLVHVNALTDLSFARVSHLVSTGMGFTEATIQAERELVLPWASVERVSCPRFPRRA